MFVATVVPCRRLSTSPSATPAFAHSPRMPSTTPRAGSSGVDGDLVDGDPARLLVDEDRSVNVPPTSTPIRLKRVLPGRRGRARAARRRRTSHRCRRGSTRPPPGTRSPTASRTTIGRKPSEIASSAECRTQPAIVTPGEDHRVDPTGGQVGGEVRAVERARPLLHEDELVGARAIRSSMAVSGVPTFRCSTGIFRTQRPMSVFGPSVTAYAVVV